MERTQVKIDFAVVKKTFRQFVFDKAKKANSTIVYVENGELIEEDPATLEKKVLRESSYVSDFHKEFKLKRK